MSVIAIPTICEISGVNRLLQAGHGAMNIYCLLCHVHGDKVMSDSSEKNCCRKFRDGSTNVRDWGGGVVEQERHHIVIL